MLSMQSAIAIALGALIGGVTAAAIAVNVYTTNDTSVLERKIEASQQRVNDMQDQGIDNMRRRIGKLDKPKD